MKGVIKRAEAVEAIDRATALRLYKQHSARGYNAAEPYPLPNEPATLVGQAITVRPVGNIGTKSHVTVIVFGLGR